MAPEKFAGKEESIKEAVKEELSSSLGPRGMSIEQMMGKSDIKNIMSNASNANQAKAQVKAFLEKKGIVKSSKSAPPQKEKGPKINK